MATILFFIFLFVSFGSLVIYSFILGISPMPSSKKAKHAIIQLLPKNGCGVIYELGSGWGGLALLLAKYYPHAKIIAFEVSPIPYLFSRIRQLLLRRSNLIIRRKNFYDHNLSDANAVVCYLFPEGMRKLSSKLEKELPDKSTIISNTFSLPDWKNGSLFYLDDLAATRIYKYEKLGDCPKRVAKE